MNYSYDSAQRLSGVTSTGSGLSGLPATLLSSVGYGPVGMTGATLGNNLAETRGYNNRTFLSSLSVGASGSVYSVGLTYTGNGDVLTGTDSVNGNWTYSYDDFNRLATAKTPPTSPTLAYSYAYDRFGNRWSQAVTTGTGWPVSLTFNGNNQITTAGYSYDAAGNVLMDNLHCYTYDAENRLSSVAPETTPGSGVCGATAMGYVYGADGRRVAKVQNGAVVKQFYYDAGGQEIAEINASGAFQRAEIFAGGRHLATWVPSATYFNHADWLGTERARTNSSGTACETITSLPFGDGQATAGGCGDPSPNHFTDKERDTESGLDNFEARYYASGLGRFMTPDWAAAPTDVPYANFGDPQSLNLYGYVRNNPLSAADLDGHNWWDEVKGVASGTWNFATGTVTGVAISAIPVYGQMKAADAISDSVVSAAQEYSSKGVSGVMNQVLDQGEQVAMEIVTQAVLTGGATALAKVDGVTPESWGAPDSNVVVRGGQGEMPPPGTKFSGAQGSTVEDAAQGVRHGQIRESTAGKIREAGGSVRSKPEPTNGVMNEKHVNIREGTRRPSTFSQLKKNPVPKKDRIGGD